MIDEVFCSKDGECVYPLVERSFIGGNVENVFVWSVGFSISIVDYFCFS
jgi:hypothetical protein